MFFNIDKNILVDSLSKVLGPTTFKQNIPILSSVLISANDNRIEFISTDLDITITYQTSNVKIIEEGVGVVPFKNLYSIAKELPQEEVSLKISDNNLLIKCGKIECKLNTFLVDDFPQLNNEKGTTSLIKMHSQDVSEMIKLTSFSVGHDDTNYVLGGVLWEIFEDEVKLVSTDGRRLSVFVRKLPKTQSDVKEKISFILPIKAIFEVYKVVKDNEGDFFLFLKNNDVGFDFGDLQIIAKPIDGEFPAYQQFIPPQGDNILKVDRTTIMHSLKRTEALSTIEYQGVKLSIKKNKLNILKQTPQLGQITETLEVEYSGDNIEIVFNSRYLMDILKNLDTHNVCFEFFGEEKPTVVRCDNGYTHLLLPMKI